MATLTKYISSADVKPQYRVRFGASYFMEWANQLLEELQERGFLDTTIKEIGQVVSNNVWLPIPSDCIELIKVYVPGMEEQEYRVENVNGKFKLIDGWYSSSETFASATTFAYPLTTAIDCYIQGYAKDALKDYLFQVTAGNLAGQGFILSGNDASDPILGTKVYFLNTLPAAFAAPDVTACEFVQPSQYVMMKYNSMITQITSPDQEFPIPDDCEARLVPTWLRWCCEREVLPASLDTAYWENKKNQLLYSIQAARSVRVNKPVGRRLIGYERGGDCGKRNVSWNTLYDRAQ